MTSLTTAANHDVLIGWLIVAGAGLLCALCTYLAFNDNRKGRP